MRRLPPLTPTPSILSAIVLPCPSLNQLGEQKSTVASGEQKPATLDRYCHYNLGRVNDQSGGSGGQ
jgi:hypothetical protein